MFSSPRLKWEKYREIRMYIYIYIRTFVRRLCTRGKMVSFNLVGYYERLGYPFRGRAMILLQFRLY